MEEMLRKMFAANPGETTISLKGKCSDCGEDVKIDITSTSGGFGLQGGALFKFSSSGYFIRCSNCYKIRPKIENCYKPKYPHIHSLA
jgi:hypothetical protein